MATIAEVLHYAADNFLWHPENGENKFEPSCSAIYWACENLQISRKQREKIFKGLQNMGLDTSVFDEFIPGAARQGARYAWLKFAALIAEEQGV